MKSIRFFLVPIIAVSVTVPMRLLKIGQINHLLSLLFRG